MMPSSHHVSVVQMVLQMSLTLQTLRISLCQNNPSCSNHADSRAPDMTADRSRAKSNKAAYAAAESPTCRYTALILVYTCHNCSMNLTWLVLCSLNIVIQCMYLLLAHFIVPKKALHGAHSKEALLLKSCTGALHLLYTWTKGAEHSIGLQALRS